MTKEEALPCSTHPDAPHGFLRNASHEADQYVCECAYWKPPREQRPDEISTEELIYMAGLHDGKKQERERPWVELTDAEIQECYSAAYKVVQGRQLEVAFARAVGVKLKEKNCG